MIDNLATHAGRTVRPAPMRVHLAMQHRLQHQLHQPGHQAIPADNSLPSARVCLTSRTTRARSSVLRQIPYPPEPPEPLPSPTAPNQAPAPHATRPTVTMRARRSKALLVDVRLDAVWVGPADYVQSVWGAFNIPAGELDCPIGVTTIRTRHGKTAAVGRPGIPGNAGTS